MLGFQPEELAGNMTMWEQLIHPEDKPWVRERLQAHFQDPTVPYRFDYRVQRKTGEYCWIANYGKVVTRDPQGKPLRMIGLHQDITNRKQIEEELRRSASQLKIAQRIGHLGSMEFDLSTGQVTWSEEMFSIFGLNPEADTPNFEEYIQKIHPDDRDHYRQVVQSATQTMQPYDLEYRIYRPDGTLRHLQSRGEFMVEKTGQHVLRIGAIQDITDRKQSEAQLRNLADRLSLALKSGAIGSWDWDIPHNILTWDDRMYELYGITAAQFTNAYDAWSSRVHPDDCPRSKAVVHQALNGEKDFDDEFRVVHPDGSIHFIKAYALVQRNVSGDPLRMVGINFDISDLKQSEIKLLQTTAQLKTSNQELEAFAYSVSHDLRSPLRAIDGFSKALLEDYGEQFGEEGKDYFERIRSNVSRMAMLIDDLLRLSRVSRTEMQYSEVNLSTLVQSQINELQAAEPERQVSVVIAPNAIVSADAPLMRVVINNLIQNAWKFTSHHATARLEFGVIEQEGQHTYFVRDDGAGFDGAYAHKLFGVFQRLHNTQEFPGTGIGLATVQRVIHRHGGQVWAEGAVEKGATFFFSFPNSTFIKGIYA